jgi:hypothetical protein
MGAASRNDLARTARALQASKVAHFKKEMNRKAASVRHARREVLAFYERNSPQIRQHDSIEHSTPESIAALIAAGADDIDDTPAPRTPEELAEIDAAWADSERRRVEAAARRAEQLTDDELFCAYLLVRGRLDVESRVAEWARGYAELPDARSMARCSDCPSWPDEKRREVGEAGLLKLRAISMREDPIAQPDEGGT